MGRMQSDSLLECDMSNLQPSSQAPSPLKSHEPGSTLHCLHFYQFIGLHLLTKIVHKAPLTALYSIPPSVMGQKAQKLLSHVSFSKDSTFFYQFSVFLLSHSHDRISEKFKSQQNLFWRIFWFKAMLSSKYKDFLDICFPQIYIDSPPGQELEISLRSQIKRVSTIPTEVSQQGKT